MADNALGDVNADKILDVRDLLILRDHVINGDGTAEDLLEADLNRNQTLDHGDVEDLRDVLLRVAAVRHLVGSDGGQVFGNDGRTVVTLPPLQISESVAFYLEDMPQAAFQSRMSSDPRSWGTDVSYLAGVRLVAIAPDMSEIALPEGVGVREFAPVGMTPDTSGTNVLLGIEPDIDGDGVPELRPLGNLRPFEQEGRVGLEVPLVDGGASAATLEGAQRVLLESGGASVIASGRPIEAGCLVLVSGSSWASMFREDYEVWWIAGADTVATTPLTTRATDRSNLDTVSGLVTMVPALNAGQYELRVWDRFSGDVSNGLQVQLQPLVVVPDEATTLPRLAQQLGVIDSLLSVEASDPLYSDVYGDYAAEIQALRDGLAVARDSVLTLHAEGYVPTMADAELVAILENDETTAFDARYVAPAGGPTDCDNVEGCVQACLDLTWERAKGKAKDKLCHWVCDRVTVGAINGWICEQVCSFIPVPNWDPDFPERWCRKSCCKLVDKLRIVRPSLEYGRRNGSDNFEWEMGCLHYCCDKGQGVADQGASSGVGEGGSERMFATFQPPLAGETSTLQVRVVDSPIPVSRGFVQADGIVRIPFNVKTGEIRFAAYDSRTGFFDDDVGRAHVTDPEQIFGFRLQYEPDTTFVQQSILLGQPYLGSLNLDRPRIVALLSVGKAEVGATVKMGLQSRGSNLTLIVRDPNGMERLSNLGETACVNGEFEADFEGTYEITISRGAAPGEFDSFVIGTALGEEPATPFLCGEIDRTAIAPVHGAALVAGPGVIGAGATVVVEEGSEIRFFSSGATVVDGMLVGSGRGLEDGRIVLSSGTRDPFDGAGFPMARFEEHVRDLEGVTERKEVTARGGGFGEKRVVNSGAR